MKNKIKIEGDESVAVQDFYKDGNLDDAEKEYLKNLVAIGSTADMIKTHAIICDDNIIRGHLQMDSNTKIYDFKLLYDQTFSRPEQTDALNACYYDKIYRYVSAHNKIVYTTIYTAPGSPLSLALQQTHIDYCKAHAKDDQNKGTKIEKLKKNSIYAKDFVVALEKVGLTAQKTLINEETGSSQVIYRASLDKKDAYRITQCIATAVNMSWAEADDPLAAMIKAAEKDFKELPSVEVLDAACDYNCFTNAVLKHAGLLTNHGDDPYDDSKSRRELLEISSPHEKKMIKAFVDKVRDEKPDMLEKVINTILIYRDRGKMLFREIFQCDPDEYKEKKEKVEYKKNTPGKK